MHMNWPITIFLADNNHFNVSTVLRLCSFEMLDLTCLNRTIKHCKGNSWKYWHLLLLSGPGGGSADCVESRLCLSNKWTWKGTRKKKPPGEMAGFLTWPILYDSIEAQENTWTSSVLYNEVMCTYSIRGIMLFHSNGSFGWMQKLTLPPKIKMWENISHERVLNCKQCSYISYEYTYYGPRGGVTWGTSVPCRMSDSVVFPAALWAYLWGPLEGSL